nr:hypothetical protein BaRGS_021994 [Batillaria attramentaria]
MKLGVLGATGPSGQQVVIQALEQGHTVIALVRDRAKMHALKMQHDNLQVQKVDLSKEEDLAAAIKGVDAVMSCLGVGQNRGMCTPCTLYTDTIVVVTNAMRLAGVTRLVCISAWGSKDAPGLPFIYGWVVKPTILRNVLADMGAMEDILSDHCPGINYTVVRPPALTMDPVSGKEIRTCEGQLVQNASNYMSRGDVAKFMLMSLATDKYDRKMVAVGVDD